MSRQAEGLCGQAQAAVMLADLMWINTGGSIGGNSKAYTARELTMKSDSYDIACLASMLIHFLTTVGVSRDEAVQVLRATEDMLPAEDPSRPARHAAVEALAPAL
ncbi:hypothetical protein [Achromobacter aloeverae]|uniref:Uncharacterized protein n=1 Tax=Achromobacter aloeverae TaxID=1750518 RepID=A0A4Q1HNP1_9BURK|nr:hypothetical protein [Achromobacter aloeverae]RXN92271.1 hypothetical protein C7R54_00445 [Achromobacter aloeverae]